MLKHPSVTWVCVIGCRCVWLKVIQGADWFQHLSQRYKGRLFLVPVGFPLSARLPECLFVFYIKPLKMLCCWCFSHQAEFDWVHAHAFSLAATVKIQLKPKCNQGFFCECTRVKPSCKSIITMKEALLRFTVFFFFRSISFSVGVLRALLQH